VSFSSDVHRIAGKMEVDIEDAARTTFIELFTSIIKDTPVDKGRLRGNWQTTRNTPAATKTSSVQKDETGQATSQAHSVVTKPDLYYLTNNMPYAETAEYGTWGTGAGATHKTTRDGFSIQAPYGMVRKNIKRLQSILRRESR